MSRRACPILRKSNGGYYRECPTGHDNCIFGGFSEDQAYRTSKPLWSVLRWWAWRVGILESDTSCLETVAGPAKMTNLQDVRLEDELLLYWARTSVDAGTADRITAILQRGIDWRYLVESANHHRVVPLVSRNSLQAADSVPQWVKDELRQGCAAIVRRNLHLTAELARLIDWLGTTGIFAIPYKGPLAAIAAYGNICLRQFADLDILVDPRTYLQTRNALLGRGYRLDPQRDFEWECTLTDEARLVSVDLHRSLAPDEFPIALDFKRLQLHLEPVWVAGRNILTPGIEDLLIILCIQLIKDGWGRAPPRLSKVCDIAELLRKHPSINWQRVVDEATVLRCRRMVSVSLIVAHRLLGAPVPPSILSAELVDRLNPLVAHVCYRVLHRTDWNCPTQMSSAKFRFQVRECWRDKIYPTYRRFRSRLHPNERDRAMVTLPPSLSFLYYLIRPIRLVRDHVKRIFGAPRAR